MRREESDIVSASEIARWAWCPEAWRLEALGHEPGNREALRRGEAFHARTAAFEVTSTSAISLGWCLLAAGIVVLAALALVLVRG